MSWLTENFRPGSMILFNETDLAVIVEIGFPETSSTNTGNPAAKVIWLEDGTQQWIDEESITAVVALVSPAWMA